MQILKSYLLTNYMLVLPTGIQYSCIALHPFSTCSPDNLHIQLLQEVYHCSDTKSSTVWNFSSPPSSLIHFISLLSHSLLLWTSGFNNIGVCYQPNSEGPCTSMCMYMGLCKVAGCTRYLSLTVPLQGFCVGLREKKKKRCCVLPAQQYLCKRDRFTVSHFPLISWHKCHSEAFPLK